MTTTPTFWGSEVTFSNDVLAYGPKITTLADGTFVLAWENGDDIFARHLNETGSFTGGNFLSTVSADASKPLSGPIITQQQDGRIVVNYNLEFDDSPFDSNVYWHSPNSTYTPHSSVFATLNTGYSEFLLDSTARYGNGGALLYSYTGPGDVTNMVLQFTDSVGNLASNQIFIDSSATRLEQNGAITDLHTGFIAVAYESVLQSGSFPREIRLHVFTPGEVDASGTVTVSAPDVSAAFPDIVELGDGSFVVAWQQTGGLAFRRYAGNGVPVDANPVLIGASSGGLLPKITPLNDNGFMVAWVAGDGIESDASPDMDIFLQRFDSSGNTVGNKIHLDNPGDQGLFAMDIATMSDGRVLLTYANETGNATNLTELNYQFFDPREKTITATDGEDNYVSREDGATIHGLMGADKLTGRANTDILFGNQGADTLLGFGGNDRLFGGEGVDILRGGGGQDRLRGGGGADNVRGGLGADVFVFAAISESTVALAGRDTLYDFRRATGDSIDLHMIDARSNKPGNQAFSFIGTDGFHDKAGELRVAHRNGDTFVLADVNGDGKADFAISMEGNHNLRALDFDL